MLTSFTRNRFAGRVALVTGGAYGIGKAIALQLAGEGASVAIVDINEENAAAARKEIVASGYDVLAVVGDVTTPGDVDRAVSQVEADLGLVDVLVNNVAGGVRSGEILPSDDVWESDIRGALAGTFLCSRRIVPSMQERRRGVIVNTSSVNGLRAFANSGAYSAAKAGVVSITQNMAVTYGPDGIRVNAVAPGTIRTPAWDKVLESDPTALERAAKNFPLGRIGRPEDIAAAVLFLASDEASWITGQVLAVDGGLLAGTRFED